MGESRNDGGEIKVTETNVFICARATHMYVVHRRVHCICVCRVHMYECAACATASVCLLCMHLGCTSMNMYVHMCKRPFPTL